MNDEVEEINKEIEIIKQHDAMPPEEKKKRIAHLQSIKVQLAMVENGEIEFDEM